MVVPIQAVTVRSSDSQLSPEERERQTAQQQARDKEDNRADVTNETLEKQKQRELRDKLQRVVFIKQGDKVKMQKVATGIADSTYIEIKEGVRPGDELHVEAEVLEVRASNSRPGQGFVKCRTTTLNQNGEPVQILVMNLLVKARAQ